MLMIDMHNGKLDSGDVSICPSMELRFITRVSTKLEMIADVKTREVR
jgi:hypothetical protein